MLASPFCRGSRWPSPFQLRSLSVSVESTRPHVLACLAGIHRVRNQPTWLGQRQQAIAFTIGSASTSPMPMPMPMPMPTAAFGSLGSWVRGRNASTERSLPTPFQTSASFQVLHRRGLSLAARSPAIRAESSLSSIGCMGCGLSPPSGRAANQLRGARYRSLSSSSQSASDRHPTAASADVVVCGAGLAGISTAFYLTEQCGVPGHRVIIIDERSPLEYTSSRSTECFRTLWQDECMARFMTRSIDLIERLHAQPPLDSVVKVEHRSSPSADLAGQARATSSAVAAPFAFRRSGYVWLTNDPQTATEFEGTARRSKAAETATTADDKRTKSTADGVRIHASLQSYTALSEAEAWRLGGADIVHGADAIRSLYPFVSPDVKAMLHARRAGSLDAQQMGSYMLARARARGVTVLRGRVTDVHVTNNAITGVMVARPSVSDGSYGGSASALHYISCPSFVNAAGPAAKGVHSLLNHAILQQRRSISDLRVSVDMQSVAHSESSSTLKGKAVPSTFALPQLPVSNEVHAKAVFLDSLNVLPADGPLMIWADPVQLQWSRDELEALSEAGPEQQRWLRLLPSGVHFRRSATHVIGLWEFAHQDVKVEETVDGFPVRAEPDFDPFYSELVIRGLSRMVPGLAQYLSGQQTLSSSVDGGYYTKSHNNRPIIGHANVGIKGAFICAALSGYGVMASHAAGELVAQMVTQAPTTFSEKPFAFPEFLLTPDRYTRPPPEPAASEDGSARRPVGGQL